MQSPASQSPGANRRNFILGLLAGGAAGLVLATLLWFMTAGLLYPALALAGLALFGGVLALLVKPFSA